MILQFAVSFFAAFIGWAVAFAGLMLWLAARAPRGITDFTFFLGWPLIFTAAGWVFFGAPFVALVPLTSKWLRLPRSILAGAVLSSAAYFILIGWLLWRIRSFTAFAPVVGAVAVPVYAALARRVAATSDTRRRRSLGVAFVAAVPLLWFAFAAAWTVFERTAPAAAYRIASTQARQRIVIRRIEVLKPGDTLADLHRDFPDRFPNRALELTTFDHGVQYTVHAESGVVTRVERRSIQR